jgi:hypothetical protein
MSYLQSLGVWNWFILGGILIVLEVFLPGSFLLWFGMAAIATGIVAYVITFSWQLQILLFAIFSVVSVLIARRFAPKAGTSTDKPFLNRRTEGIIGRVFVLDQPIVGGTGRVRIGDSPWLVSGPDCPAGTHVRVERADGNTLVVVRLD